MTILIGFFAPLLLFAIAWIFRERLREQLPSTALFAILPLVLIFIVAVWTALSLLITISLSPATFSSTQIVWQGLISKENTLAIGGPRSTSVIGWPNENDSPTFEVAQAGTGVNFSIRDSVAFLQNTDSGSYLNGKALAVDGTPLVVQSSDKALTLNLRSSWVFWAYLDILDGETLLVEIPIRPARRDQVTPLATLISVHADTLTDADPVFRRVEDAKRYFSDIRTLITATGEVRILTRDMNETGSCEPPGCRYSLLWGTSPTKFTLDVQKGNRVRVDFLPPYRAVSPLPTLAPNNGLLITGRILPGDYAFGLPLGDREPLRDMVSVRAGDDGKYFLAKGSDPPKENAGPPPFGIKVRSNAAESIVEGRNLDLIFRISEESFSWVRLACFLSAAIALLMFGAILAFRRLPSDEAWTVLAFAAVVWIILMVRLLLALRFALELAFLDRTAVQGVALSLFPLVAVPALIFIVARFARGNPARRARWSIWQTYFLFAVAASLIMYYGVGFLWPNLPESFAPWPSGFSAAILAIGIGNLLLAQIVLRAVFTRVYDRVIAVLFNAPRALTAFFQRLWTGLADKGLTFWAFFGLVLILVVAPLYSILVYGTSLIVGATFGGASKFIQQVLAPLPLYVLLLLCWLALRKVKQNLPLIGISIFALFFVGMLLVVLPIALSDNGNIFPGVAIILSLSIILLVSGWRNRQRNLLAAGGAFLCTLFLGFAVFQLLVREVLPISLLPPTAQARILAYQKGLGVQHYLLTAEVGRDAEGLRYRDLMFASQHQWEAQSITHEAKFFGFGFGNAPVRRSQIRLDTVQFDTLFSFYILGDFGLIGGLFLLLISAGPLFVIIFGGRNSFDTGYAAGFVVALLFCLEGLTHAAMNLGVLPMTGRSFPLLAVNSFAGDLLRWALLFSFAIWAVFFRFDQKGVPEQSDTFVDLVPVPDAQPGSAGSRARFVPQWVSLTVVPAVMIVALIIANTLIWWDTSLDAPLTLDLLRRDVERIIDDGVVSVSEDQDGPKLSLSEEKFDKSVLGEELDRKQVRQQIALFNAMPLEQRTGDPIGPISSRDLIGISSREAFDRFLAGLRNRPSTLSGIPMKNIFRLRRQEVSNEDEVPETGPAKYAVEFNPDFNIKFSFKEAGGKEEIPIVMLQGQKQQLIGPAWNRGRWITAYDPDPSLLSWTDLLATSLKQEWKNLDPAEASKLYGVLTLDRELQRSTLRFMDSKARALHGSVLQKYSSSGHIADKLPPRVGLTVLKLGESNRVGSSLPARNGEVVALAGAPRTSPGDRWGESGDLPPNALVESLFPIELQRRYLGDRNFEANLVMGSSTKPLWAAAALAVHPGLNTQLKVRGETSRENSVFGIRIVPDNSPQAFWSVTQTGWVDFNTYLARSDNRYQVRLGFLGLAEKNGGPIELGAATNSQNESLGGTPPRPIGRYPLFASQLAFGPERPGSIANLHKSGLAEKFRSMYAAAVVSAKAPEEAMYKDHLISFWTMSEKDDVLAPFARSQKIETGGLRGQSFLHSIMPTRVNLGLDEIETPRDFVSVLLGGHSNRWSNVQMAAAFATCVTGVPVLPHIVKTPTEPEFVKREPNFAAISNKLAPGSKAVVFDGTATRMLTDTGALAFLSQLQRMGYEVYGKTGTLVSTSPEMSAVAEPTSRFVLAIVKFSDRPNGKISSGLVFSIFGERAGQHAADRWLGEFLVANQGEILRLLGEDAAVAARAAARPTTPIRRSRRR